MLEYLLFEDGDINGVKAINKPFSGREKLEQWNFYSRLNADTFLKSEEQRATTRKNFTAEIEEKLVKSFMAQYGKFIIKAFESFSPYEYNNKAASDLKEEINKDCSNILPMLYEGQSQYEVFKKHHNNLKSKLEREYGDLPAIDSAYQIFEKEASQLIKYTKKFEHLRAKLYLENVSDKSKIYSQLEKNESDGKSLDGKVISFINNLYDDVFTTVAFECALVCTFFNILEKSKERTSSIDKEIEKFFEDYISSLNAYFVPKTSSELKKLIAVLYIHEYKGDHARDWEELPSSKTFKKVLMADSFMQPKKWPVYRYLLLELWAKGTFPPFLKESLFQELDICRLQVFSSLHSRKQKEYCEENGKVASKLTSSDEKKISQSAYETYEYLIKNIQALPLDKEKLQILPKMPSTQPVQSLLFEEADIDEESVYEELDEDDI